MSHEIPGGMREALRLTRAGRLMEATRALQHMLGRHEVPAGAEAGHPPTIDGTAEAVDMPESPRMLQSVPVPVPGAPVPDTPVSGTPIPVPERRGTRGILGLFRAEKAGGRGAGVASSPHALAGGRFLAMTFNTSAGGRPYKLYIPSGYRAETPVPLIVMLHGCTQSPDDFAAGTRMNAIAEEQGFLVAYPAQISAANARKCWNWFNPADQRRDGGEPALIAGITREIMRDHAIDPRRVYVAGLSAGGAAAAIMGEAYPDLYAAVGVHSGLACGAARDMPSAFAAMKQGHAVVGKARGALPVIVFHGDRDTTVNPRNGDGVAARVAGVAESRSSLP